MVFSGLLQQQPTNFEFIFTTRLGVGVGGGQPPRDPLLFAVKLTQFSSSFFKGKIYDSFPAKYRHN